jgi:cytochrome c biogenesis protein CcmG, thiol:disulfide interchange protein DsbE
VRWLLHPVITLRALASRNSDVMPMIWTYVAMMLVVNSTMVANHLSMIRHAPIISLNRIVHALFVDVRVDFLVVGIAAAVVGMACAVRPTWRAHAWSVPRSVVGVLAWLGCIHLAAAGVAAISPQPIGVLPVHSVDHWFGLIERGAVQWWVLCVRCVLLYGPALALLVAVARETVVPPRAARVGAVLLVGWLVFAALAVVVQTVAHHDEQRPRTVGDKLPAAKLARLGERNQVDIATLGGIRIVDFWASWCPPCRRSLPELVALSQQTGATLVAVNREPEAPDAAAAAWTQLAGRCADGTCPTVISVVDRGSLAAAVGISTLPTTLVVDATNTIRFVHLGYTDAAMVAADLAALQAEHSAPAGAPTAKEMP